MCIPDPCTAASGFGMKVACTPASKATSRTTRRNVITLSAMVSASVYRRSISCWLGASSWWLYSTGIPMASSVWMVRWRMSEATSAVVRSKYEAWSRGSGGSEGSEEAK